MKFEVTTGGTSVLRINTSVYLSFGKTDDPIKFILVSMSDRGGSQSKMFPVSLNRIPATFTKAIGRKNIKRIRELLNDYVEGDVLPRKNLRTLGDIINREGQSK
jgi:hypothetical protein